MEGIIYSHYEKTLKDLQINEYLVYIESHAGGDLGGNLYYIAKEFLSGQYGTFRVAIGLKQVNNLPQNVNLLLNKYGESNIQIIEKDTKEYVEILATAKYLLTDVQFSNYYRKREGQICVQTWHGTPLKKLGYDFINDVAWTGAQKKSFIDSDIILYPNEYTKKNMSVSYRLDNICESNAYIGGYPRNAIFFDDEIRKKVRESEKISDKKVFAYMPTWRGSLGSVDEDNTQLKLLDVMDNTLDDGKFLYVKFHRLMLESIDFTKYTRVRPFPSEWETYEFLTAIDCLITDYSSVMFDFLCTRRKIILYTYDKKEYLKKQGTYFDIDKLPFPQIDAIESLVNQMDIIKDYDDEKAFKDFCSHDNQLAAKTLVQEMLKIDKERKGKLEKKERKKKERKLLLYGGNLKPDEHTTQFVDFVDSLVEKKYDISVCYKNIDFIKNPINLQVFQLPVDLISIDYYQNDVFFDTENCKNNEKLWKLAYAMQFHRVNYEKIICYIDTYDEVLKLFASAPGSVTFVVQEQIMSEKDYKKVLELGQKKKVSIVKELTAIEL